ncbi:MAG: hypothetical protein MJZ37_02130 [Bacilli bacterium]|nr:hypothetical protein [Bacilli bacterium]
MMTKRYDTTSALVRYIAGVITLVAFFLLFGTIIKTDGVSKQGLKFAEVFFGTNGSKAHVYGFIAQVFVLLAGVFGVLIPIVGIFTEKEKMFSYIAGGVLVFAGIIIFLIKVLYPAIEGATDSSMYHLSGSTIASGVLAIVAGGLNVGAAFIKE